MTYKYPLLYRANRGSSKREQVRGANRWHSSVRQVAGSPPGEWSVCICPKQPGCVLDPSSLRELSLLSEAEVIVVYKVIVNAFGGSVSAGLWASLRKGHIHGCLGQLPPFYLPVWILFLGDGS